MHRKGGFLRLVAPKQRTEGAWWKHRSSAGIETPVLNQAADAAQDHGWLLVFNADRDHPIERQRFGLSESGRNAAVQARAGLRVA
ncbi:MAG: hypothetical protein AAGH92_06590 [Planctomycetota bacterium]